MLVQVDFQGKVKWVRVPMIDDRYDYRGFVEGGKLFDAVASNFI